ncbi:MAG: Modulator of FtsH protease HflK [Verrucomicrobia subdivision 3 bacterium]|nr:Modulator of FtsH protease HflK [Limisphaerales bacterium]MCS1412856.1 Modulator of FtsH protease HflK [Limisphaerales bacterium]
MSNNDEKNLPDLPEKLPEKPLESSDDLIPEAPMEDAGAKALADALSSSFKFVRALMIILVVVFLGSGIFAVNPNEVAVVLRFGKPVGTGSDQILAQGLHWSFPYPIDEIVRIPTRESRTIDATNCWYRVTPEMEVSGELPGAASSLQPGVDGYALTADGNIIHARATANYRIKDPLRYSFHYLDVTNILENALNNAVLYAAARFNAETALYKDKVGFRDAVRLRFLEKIKRADLGVELEPIEVQSFPPMYVKQAFDQVLEAEQALSQTRNKAEGEALEITRKAVGEGQALISDGITRSNMLVQSVQADAKFFADQLAHYKRDPKLFKERLLVETMSQVLTNVSDKWFLPDALGKSPQQLRLILNREPVNYTGNDPEEDE